MSLILYFLYARKVVQEKEHSLYTRMQYRIVQNTFKTTRGKTLLVSFPTNPLNRPFSHTVLPHNKNQSYGVVAS